ncbi:MAG: alpha/beta fold hydrolase [Anaerolineae bacterium]|jgi:pimeloyl-ACP methyl ester carboxylesterase
MSQSFKIESLLSARLFMSPQLVGDRLFFLSDLSGRLSLYAMDKGGSVPEPLLPPDIALQNPILMNGLSFFVFPLLGNVLVMIDQDGDENYQPCFVPMEGGQPEPAFGDRFVGQQVNCVHGDLDRNVAVFTVDPRTDPNNETFLVDLAARQLSSLGTSLYGNWFGAANDDYGRITLLDGYTVGDHVLYLWDREVGERTVLYGKPLEERTEGETVSLNAIDGAYFVANDKGLLLFTSLFDDRYGLGYLPLDAPDTIHPVEIVGTVHEGQGELTGLRHLEGERYLITYNIDGCSWAYDGTFVQPDLRFEAERVICGQGELADGVIQALGYEKASGNYAISFATATSPTQIYTIEGRAATPVRHTRERILGIPQHLLSAGEDATYMSHDGLQISARVYLPAAELGYEGKRPVVFYIHGGPQSQERPDFAWFSMPLVQFLTLNGFAVFVPNVRGSSGYGLEYMKRVDHDWGGQDRLDHVAAFEHLQQDPRLDVDRAAVVGRSYGGYMTLMLAGRHPELWGAACDMFGPYNLLTFIDRLPETWKTYFYLAIGHPDTDREFLIERSPKTYLHQLACPMLVIQGANDPRVREAESRDVVEELRAQGKEIEYLVFENEGHDVIKFENKVRCYNEITSFFVKHLQPGA